MAARVIPQMHYIEQKMIEENLLKEERILTLLINSPGGSVTDGLAIYDTINMLECKVRTTCVGLAASTGAFLLSSGSRGMRLALPNSEILIHQPLGGAQLYVQSVYRSILSKENLQERILKQNGK